VILGQMRRTLARTALGIVVAATMIATTVAVTSSAAQAARTGPALSTGHARGQTTFTMPAHMIRFSSSAGTLRFTVIKSPKQVQASTSCTLNAQTPVYEGTTNGEEGIATLQCTQPVSELYLQVGLQLNEVLVSSNSNETYSSSYVAAFTTYVYSPGIYETLSAGVVCTSSCATGYADSPSV
jgi:hypothetical protein